MKKFIYLLLAFGLVLSACKKGGGSENGGENPDDDNNNNTQEQVYECLPKQIRYIDHQDPSENETINYFYRNNVIDYKDRIFVGGDTYRYTYFYEDESKGLLDRIEILIGGQLVAKVEYTIQNDLITDRDLLVKSTTGSWLTAWEVDYTYDSDGKVTQIRVIDHDLWNDGQNPTDETAIYTYTGDNVTNIQWYDTNDMNTLKEEYTYEYDNGKRAFANVLTQTYPTTRVNNIIHTIHQVYGSNPTLEETYTQITYNSKNFPVTYQVTDDRNTPIFSEEVDYDNCD